MKTIRTVLLVFVCVMPLSTLAVITIKNNGYQGLEIVIHNDVRENLQLLDRIKVRKQRIYLMGFHGL